MSKPLGALWRDRFELDNPALENEAADPAVERLIAHRTQRLYADDPVPAPVLDTLIAAALSAATKSDLQQVSFIRIRDRALRERIGALLPGMPWIVQAPEFFVVCGDNRRIRRVCALRGLPYENDTMDAVLNATIDAAIAMQQMVCAAEIMGLGCCHISHVRDHVETIAEMLEIPDHVFPISGLCVGWPAREGFVSVRLAPSATIHTDRYDASPPRPPSIPTATTTAASPTRSTATTAAATAAIRSRRRSTSTPAASARPNSTAGRRTRRARWRSTTAAQCGPTWKRPASRWGEEPHPPPAPPASGRGEGNEQSASGSPSPPAGERVGVRGRRVPPLTVPRGTAPRSCAAGRGS